MTKLNSQITGSIERRRVEWASWILWMNMWSNQIIGVYTECGYTEMNSIFIHFLEWNLNQKSFLWQCEQYINYWVESMYLLPKCSSGKRKTANEIRLKPCLFLLDRLNEEQMLESPAWEVAPEKKTHINSETSQTVLRFDLNVRLFYINSSISR